MPIWYRIMSALFMTFLSAPFLQISAGEGKEMRTKERKPLHTIQDADSFVGETEQTPPRFPLTKTFLKIWDSYEGREMERTSHTCRQTVVSVTPVNIFVQFFFVPPSKNRCSQVFLLFRVISSLSPHRLILHSFPPLTRG